MDALFDVLAIVFELVLLALKIVFYAIFGAYWLLCRLFIFMITRGLDAREAARPSSGSDATHAGEGQVSN